MPVIAHGLRIACFAVAVLVGSEFKVKFGAQDLLDIAHREAALKLSSDPSGFRFNLRLGVAVEVVELRA